MGYRTILVHCNDARRIGSVLAPAAALAERFQARLVGLSIVPPILVLPAGAPGAPDTVVVDTQCQAYREENPALKAAFESVVGLRKLASEWREAEAGSDSVANVALRHVRAADLVVAGQTDPEWLGTGHLDIADRLAVESGRPVLVVPRAGAGHDLGQNVLVAWNGRREAARAVFDALPILQQAKSVRIVAVSQQSADETAEDAASMDISGTLERHGVRCGPVQTVGPRGGIGQTLLTEAKDHGCDLLVMGCYGHSRLREFVLGGASRYILSHMTIPVLMSH
jgi:nucleotide-binding universal stress UspA family protein